MGQSCGRGIGSGRRELNRKRLSEQLGDPDPLRISAPDQDPAASEVFDFIAIGHTDMINVDRLGIDFYYDHDRAMDVARQLVRMARSIES